jgi:hypothetical protein
MTRRFLETLVWALVILGFIALGVLVALAPVRRDEVVWERVDDWTSRGCDAKGNLLYRHIRGGFAGIELIVVEGGCR